ncbi:MAG: ferrochelatase [Gemmatales bacterium]|nr:ferrochelatase [Gemmatales bacterium]MDW8387144.1 ferrochelatase [Gemmatales bacterium]
MRHNTKTPPLGVLMLQLGTPDAPTAQALRPYLRQFLSDPRVIEPPPRYEGRPRVWRILWWLILNGIILTTRPRQSAEKYARIWSQEHGSPLLYWTRRQAEDLQKTLPEGFRVAFGMRYGEPSIARAVKELLGAGCERFIVLPMYPQYSATTTASALDGLFDVLKQERLVPALRIVPPYYEHPAYLDAVVEQTREELARLAWEPEFYLFSYHGIPQSYVKRGDVYARHVERTTQAVVSALELPRGKWARVYQSLFGKEAWLKPYAEEKIKQLASQGVKRLFICTPGFTADCLETVDEIGYELREVFVKHGGSQYHRCPCLNDHPRFIEALKTLVLEEASGWLCGERTRISPSIAAS